jgi:hypothetical protein
MRPSLLSLFLSHTCAHIRTQHTHTHNTHTHTHSHTRAHTNKYIHIRFSTSIATFPTTPLSFFHFDLESNRIGAKQFKQPRWLTFVYLTPRHFYVLFYPLSHNFLSYCFFHGFVLFAFFFVLLLSDAPRLLKGQSLAPRAWGVSLALTSQSTNFNSS